MDAPPEVAAANAAARAMLRDHLRDYVERNGDDASYRSVDRHRASRERAARRRAAAAAVEHRAMWDARPRVTASRQASGGLVALLVGAVFAFAVFAARSPSLRRARRRHPRSRGCACAGVLDCDQESDVECLSSRLLAGVAAVFLCRWRWRCSSPTRRRIRRGRAPALERVWRALHRALRAQPKGRRGEAAPGSPSSAPPRAGCGLERRAASIARAPRVPSAADGASELADGV